MTRCAGVVLTCFVVAGLVQTAFLKSAASARFAQPLDGGRTLRGRRLLGQNKTWRGVVVLVPSVALCFGAAGLLQQRGELGPGLWALGGPWGWISLGWWVGWAYALGELPNSFIKRQLDVPPGQLPRRWLGRRVALIVDQIDSIAAALLALALLVPTDGRFHGTCLLVGGGLHWGFNGLLRLIGLKEEAR